MDSGLGQRLFARIAIVLTLVAVVAGCAPTQTAAPKPTSAPAAPAAQPTAAAAAPAAKPTTAPAAPAPKPAAEPVKLTLGVGGEIFSYAPTNIAVAAGFFAAQGLNVERVVLQGDPGVATALTSGDIQFGAHSSGALLGVVSKGAPRVAVYGLSNKMSLDMVVSNAFLQKKGVSPSDPLDKRLKSLSGGQYGALSLGGVADRMTRHLVELGGANPQTDLEVVKLGSVPEHLAGLKQGSIDGFMLSPPAGPSIESDGAGKILIRGSEIPGVENYTQQIVAVNADYAKQNPDVVKRFAAALTQASDLIAKEPEKATDLLQPFYQSVPRPVLLKSVESMKDAVINGGRMTAESWQSVIKVEVPDANLDPRSGQGQWWTNEYLP